MNISTSKAIVMYVTVSCFLFFEMAVQVSPSIMVPELMRDLNIGPLTLGFMSSVYFYSYTAMQIPSGLLFDRYNPRLIIIISIFICSLGCLLFGSSQSIWMGCLSRFLMGLGSAFAFVSVLVVTSDLFAPRYFAIMTGITQMMAALGAMFGQMPVGLLVANVGWRHTMFILFGIGIVLLLLVSHLLKYQRRSKSSDEASHRSDNQWQQLKNVLTQPRTWFIALYACLLWAPMSGFVSLWGVPFLMEVDHLNANTAAFMSSLMWLGLAVVSPLLGYLALRQRRSTELLWISAAMGLLAFAAILFWQWPLAWLGVFLFIAGGACAGQALSFAVVKEINNPGIVATAMAFNNMAVVISGAIFQPLMGKIIEVLHASSKAHALQTSCMVILLAYVVATIIAWRFIRNENAI